MPPEIYATPAEVLAAWPEAARFPEQELADLVADANQAVRDFVGRDLLLAERRELHDGLARPKVWLRVVPVVEVYSVSIDGRPLDDAWTVTPATGRLVRGDGRSDPRFARRFPAGSQNVEVVYLGGFESVPPPVRRATILTARRLSGAGDQADGLQSESLGDWSYTRASDAVDPLPTFVKRLLRPYKVKAV